MYNPLLSLKTHTMVPPDIDADRNFMETIDDQLILADQQPDVVFTPEARATFAKVRAAYERLFEAGTPHEPIEGSTRNESLMAMVRGIEAEVEGVEFRGNDHVGFFVVPGVTVMEGDGRRNLVIAYIDWEHSTPEELTELEHFHVGRPGITAEIADVWAIPDVSTGLVWADHTRPELGIQTHFPENGLRMMVHGSHDGYSAISELPDHEKEGMPKVYFGPYWGRISKREQAPL